MSMMHCPMITSCASQCFIVYGTILYKEQVHLLYEQFSTNKCLNVYGMILMILYKAMCLPSRNMSGPYQPGKHVFPERCPTGNRSLFLGRSVAHKLCRDASELRRSVLLGLYPAQGVERYVVKKYKVHFHLIMYI